MEGEVSQDAGITVRDHDGIRVLTLNRPERLNAFDAAMEEAVIQSLLDAQERQGIRAIVLTGAGRGFCAGHDYREVVSHGAPAGPGADASQQNRIPQALLRLDKPVIGAINGVAAGGGFAIALSCDIRIASTAATFRELHVVRGTTPGVELWLLPRSIGLSRTIELMATGRQVDAPTAMSWGLLAKVTPPEALLAEALALAQSLAALPPAAFALAKRATYLGLQSSLHDTLQYIATARTITRYAGESQRGAQAFLEKRA